MFVMMNAARYAVGLEGLAQGDRAYQKAVGYARERVQGRAIEGSAEAVAIIQHPDIRRMLMLMRAQNEAMRAVAYVVAAAWDHALRSPSAEERASQQAFVDLMIPVVKAWLTETGNEVASLGLQIHGGMGYIEETGAAQIFRDARITTIYEGTTGIQALDLIGRKVARDGGAALKALLLRMRQTEQAAEQSGDAGLQAMAMSLRHGIHELTAAGDYVASHYGKDVRAVAAGAVPFLKLMGIVCGGWLMTRGALIAWEKIGAGNTDPFYPAKLVTARFYAEHVLVAAQGLAAEVLHGGASALALDEAAF
jgi:hypothetical protein